MTVIPFPPLRRPSPPTRPADRVAQAQAIVADPALHATRPALVDLAEAILRQAKKRRCGVTNLSPYEIDVLRCIDGQDVPGLLWGAALSEALETLRGKRLVRMIDGRATITEEGKAELAALKGGAA